MRCEGRERGTGQPFWEERKSVEPRWRSRHRLHEAARAVEIEDVLALQCEELRDSLAV